ncbi:MAG: phosphoenolpyruvate carboxylase, partial [Paraglaciecola sp.]|uniref:phosphoenolpyruvate carboxylase n=1 Tax=Paraglaciecola sp. TaxID=1920173 RepID=UPI00329A6EAD
MSQVLDSQLTGTVRNLGAVLGDTIREQLGEHWLDRIEAVRKDGRKAHQGDEDAAKRVKQLFTELKNDELLTVGRAFSQFLNLANIAEQEFNSNNDSNDPIDTLFNHLDEAGIQADTFEKALDHLNIELVLTAHPTEVTRRTLIHKHSELAKCLSKVHQSEITETHRDKIETRIAEIISQAWHTEEIRTIRPTPVDEARWGFSVIENSLWEAVPDFIRELDKRFVDKFDLSIPLDVAPVKFGSWMGGDRDGNPFVTSKVTEQVLLLARKRAAKLFAKDID